MREKYVEQRLRKGEALLTASGRNIGRAEVSRNKRSPRGGVAPIEAADVRHMRERDVERKLVRMVRDHGGLALKLVSPGFNGVPDRLLLFTGGRAAFCEVKAPGQKPRPLQVHRMEQLRELGFRVYMVDSEDGVRELLEDIKTDTSLTRAKREP